MYILIDSVKICIWLSWSLRNLQNQISPLLVGVCCFCQSDVTLFSCRIIVSLFVWYPIPDFICDRFLIATF